MSIQDLRFVDFWVGLPLTWLLTLVRKAFGWLPAGAASSKKILFIKFSEQGSTVIARQIIQTAADTYGRDNVFFVVFKDNKEILSILDLIPEKNILTIKTRSLWNVAWDLTRVLWRSWTSRIDTVIDLEFTSRASALLAFLSGARKRVGFFTFFDEGPYRGDLFTHRVQFNPHFHTVILYHILFTSHKADASQLPLTKFSLKDFSVVSPPQLKFSNDECHQVLTVVESELHAKLHPSDTVIVLNANASDLVPIRKWPEAHFVELAQRLLAAYPKAYLLFTGNRQEAAFTEKMVQSLGMPRVASLAGKLSLRQFVTLLSLSDLLVSNDSGPAHFSSLTDVHRIVLFGPETPDLFSPLGENLSVIYEARSCSPCVSAYNHRHSRCTDNVCMKSISVEQVFMKVQEVLTRGNSQDGREDRKFLKAASE